MQTSYLFLFSNFSLFFFLLQVASLNGPSSSGLKFENQSLEKPNLSDLIFFVLAGLCAFLVLVVSFSNASSLITSFTIMGLFIISFLSYRLLNIGVAPWLGSILISLILLLQFFLKSAPFGFHLSRELADGLLKLHISVSIVGQALSLLACILAFALIRQQKNLKNKRLKEFSRGPGLTKIDRLLMQALQFGLYFYTAALFTGALMAQTLELGDQFRLGWKTIWALAVWLSYLFLIKNRHLNVFSARKTAIYSFLTMSVLIVIFFVLQFGVGSGS